MSRSGVETKLPWQSMPAGIRKAVEHELGNAVRRAIRVYGGYAPSATYRLLLEDGRRAFFKGVGGELTNEWMELSIRQEERVYRQLGDVLLPWAPEFYGAFNREGWQVLLLEDVGPSSVPPWTAAKLKMAAHGYAAFHQDNLKRRLPRWLTREFWQRFSTIWDQIEALPKGLGATAALAGDRTSHARTWLTGGFEVLRDSAARLTEPTGRDTILHLDSRSDNVRVNHRGLRLLDWNLTSVGPPEFDVAAFAESIAAEGGPAPERFVELYEERLPLDRRMLAACVAGLAGYFASVAWQPPLPNLPRLRLVQRRQLKVCMAWAARLHGLTTPTWLDDIDVASQLRVRG